MRKPLSRSYIVFALASLIAIGVVGGLLFLKQDSRKRNDAGSVAMTDSNSKSATQSEALKQRQELKAENHEKTLPETKNNAPTQLTIKDSGSKKDKPSSAEADSETDSADVAARIQKARALRHEITEEAVEILKSFLDDENLAVVSTSLNSLAYIGKGSHLEDKVFDILYEKSNDMKFTAHGQALIIAAMFGRDDQILPVISGYITAEDDEQGAEKRLYAARALAAVASSECVDSLQLIIERSKDIQTKRSALHTLSRIDSPKATQVLEKTLYDGYSEDQLESIWALSISNKPEYNQILYDAMTNRLLDEPAVSVVARNPAGPALLKEVLHSSDFNTDEKVIMLKIYAENMTKTTSEVRSGIVEAVEPLVNDSSDDLSLEAIRILGTGFGPEDTTEILNPRFESSNREIRRAALDAYVPYLSENNYKPLLDLIWDDDEKVRRNAFMLSEQYIDESDLPVLEKALKHEDETIREAASIILKKYKTN